MQRISSLLCFSLIIIYAHCEIETLKWDKHWTNDYATSGIIDKVNNTSTIKTQSGQLIHSSGIFSKEQEDVNVNNTATLSGHVTIVVDEQSSSNVKLPTIDSLFLKNINPKWNETSDNIGESVFIPADRTKDAELSLNKNMEDFKENADNKQLERDNQKLITRNKRQTTFIYGKSNRSPLSSRLPVNAYPENFREFRNTPWINYETEYAVSPRRMNTLDGRRQMANKIAEAALRLASRQGQIADAITEVVGDSKCSLNQLSDRKLAMFESALNSRLPLYNSRSSIYGTVPRIASKSTFPKRIIHIGVPHPLLVPDRQVFVSRPGVLIKERGRPRHIGPSASAGTNLNVNIGNINARFPSNLDTFLGVNSDPIRGSFKRDVQFGWREKPMRKSLIQKGMRSSGSDYYAVYDMAIEGVSNLICDLIRQSGSDIGMRVDCSLDANVLNLAAHLVQKVFSRFADTLETGISVFTSGRYGCIDELLRSMLEEDERYCAKSKLRPHANLLSRHRIKESNIHQKIIEEEIYRNYRDTDGFRRSELFSMLNDWDSGRQRRVKRQISTVLPNYNIRDFSQNQEYTYNRREWSHGAQHRIPNQYYNQRLVPVPLTYNENISLSSTRHCGHNYHSMVFRGDRIPTNSGSEITSNGFFNNYMNQFAAAKSRQETSGLTSRAFQPTEHTASMLYSFQNKVPTAVIRLSEEARSVISGTQLLQKLSRDHNVTPNTFFEFLRGHGFDIKGGNGGRVSRKLSCNSLAKFRTFDGSCNNEENPTWGQSYKAFARILSPRYADGIHAIPVSVTKKELPNPRLISTQLFSRRSVKDPLFTLVLMQWGQILAHDFARQITDQRDTSAIECCTSDGSSPLPKIHQHPSCLPMILPLSDNFYSSFGQRCMNFVRSMTIHEGNMTLSPANQLNGATSFLDLSPLYGSDKLACDSLRKFEKGLMTTEWRHNHEVENGRIMMPTTNEKSNFCDIRNPTETCYKTGDARVNQNPQLVILETLFLREHNRIASELSRLNPHWDDERIFQESRRILIAEYQHITYHDWLPIVIGNEYCKNYSVCIEQNKMSNMYDVRVNPTTINGFTAGAFRILHSTIDGYINLIAPNYDVTDKLRLSDHYFRPDIVEQSNNFEALLRGLIHQPMQSVGSHFTSEITEYLFRSKNKFGMDLEAIDIQRGRDHGLPGYNTYRKLCELKYASEFFHFDNEIPLDKIRKLQDVYEHVDDVDLLTGAAMETPSAGSLLGPTLQCIIGEQFYRSRVGDKYFYDNANFSNGFSYAQFHEIQKASLSRIICDLGGAVSEIQPNPFMLVSEENPLTPCKNLPRINLFLWKDLINYDFEI